MVGPEITTAAVRVHPHYGRIVVRSLQMVRALCGAGFVFLRGWMRERGGREAALRAAGRAAVSFCNRLGATLVKVGQIASTRSDLLPRSVVDELATLQDQVPPFAFADVRRTIETEFGVPLERLYSEFEQEPVAAASVAQVHRAVLRSNGAIVAVKVRRPDIVEKVELDRSILLFVARMIERFVPTAKLMSLEAAVRNFCAAVEEQIHFTNEARNNRRFTANFAGDPNIHIPVLYPEACSDAVLTMEFIDGVREQDLDLHEIDVREVVRAGMRGVCRMIFLHGFVHADLHPGNLRFRPPAQIIVFDLGLTATMTEEDRLSNAHLLFALCTGDGKTVAKILFDNAPWKGTRDYSAYERDICQYVESIRRQGLANLQITLEIARIFDILRRHRIHARGHMTMVNLAMMTAEGLGKRLAPDLSLTDEALPYLVEALGIQGEIAP